MGCCCCGGNIEKVKIKKEEYKMALICRDTLFPHPVRTKTCEALAKLPFAMSLYSRSLSLSLPLIVYILYVSFLCLTNGIDQQCSWRSCNITTTNMAYPGGKFCLSNIFHSTRISLFFTLFNNIIINFIYQIINVLSGLNWNSSFDSYFGWSCGALHSKAGKMHILVLISITL